jgi:hypothetical protein
MAVRVNLMVNFEIFESVGVSYYMNTSVYFGGKRSDVNNYSGWEKKI